MPLHDATTGANIATSGNFSHSCSGSNRVLYVFFHYWMSDSSREVSSVTYNGVALTRVAKSARSSDNDGMEIWRLVAPATGANNVAYSVSGAGTVNGRVTAISVTDAHQTIPESTTPTTGTGQSTSPSINVATGGTTDLVIDGIALDATGVTLTMVAQSGRTQRANASSGFEFGACSTQETPANPESMNWSVSANRHYAMAAVAVQAAGAGGQTVTSAGGTASSAQVYTPTIKLHVADAGGIPTSAAVPQPTARLRVEGAGGNSSTAQAYAPTVRTNVTGAGSNTSTAAAHAPTLKLSVQGAGGTTSAVQAHSPTIKLRVEPGALASTAQAYSPTVRQWLTGAGSTPTMAAAYAPVVGGNTIADAGGIASSAAVYSPTARQNVTGAGSSASTAQAYGPSVKLTIQPGALGSSAVVYAPTVGSGGTPSTSPWFFNQIVLRRRR